MTKVLILVHGMGVHPKGWSKEIVDKLDAVADQYPSFNGKQKFHERVDIREISYDDVFTNIVGTWQSDASQLDAWAKASGRELPKLVGWLRSPMPSEAKGFFWSTAIQPLLYRGFHLVRDAVRASVTDQIAAIANDVLANGSAEITVLSHSLGTMVTHDSLDLLGRGYKGNEVLAATRWGFTNLFMLADVCQLARKLTADIDYFDSVVRPSTAGKAGETYCQFFNNDWHRFDPFAVSAAFRPGTWGDNYIPIGPLGHFHNANVHGFTHYLDHPLVHAPLINAALGPGPDGRFPISDADQNAALATYPVTIAKGCDAPIASVKDAAMALAGATDFEETIIGVSQFLASARQAADVCVALASKDMFV
jgi:hypothetical protein